MGIGRPAKELDWEKLDLFLQYNPSLLDAAALCGVGKDKILEDIVKYRGKTFSEYRDEKMATTRLRLVQQALDMAIKNGNAALLIFCLKNLCKWSDAGIDEGKELRETIQITYKQKV